MEIAIYTQHLSLELRINLRDFIIRNRYSYGKDLLQ